MQLIYQRVDTLLNVMYMYTAISIKVVGNVNETIPKGIAGGVEFTENSSKKFERMAQEAIDMFASAKGKQQK